MSKYLKVILVMSSLALASSAYARPDYTQHDLNEAMSITQSIEEKLKQAPNNTALKTKLDTAKKNEKLISDYLKSRESTANKRIQADNVESTNKNNTSNTRGNASVWDDEAGLDNDVAAGLDKKLSKQKNRLENTIKLKQSLKEELNSSTDKKVKRQIRNEIKDLKDKIKKTRKAIKKTERRLRNIKK